jgi:hypothetical protein
LLSPDIIEELLLDMYGNYVIQKALSVCEKEDQEFILHVKKIFY